MFRLDYLSCLLTIASTLLIGRRLWQGWVVAGANSAVICYIGVRTAQTGFVPANLFCIAMYAYNIVEWRKPAARELTSQEAVVSDEHDTSEAQAKEEAEAACKSIMPADAVVDCRVARSKNLTQPRWRVNNRRPPRLSFRAASAVSSLSTSLRH